MADLSDYLEAMEAHAEAHDPQPKGVSPELKSFMAVHMPRGGNDNDRPKVASRNSSGANRGN